MKTFVKICESNSINRTSIDWKQFQKKADSLAKDCKTPSDCYPAIKELIKDLADKHSFLMTPEEYKVWKESEANDSLKIPGPVPFAKKIGEIGYLNLPWFYSGNEKICQLFADTLNALVQELDRDTLKGWIIDIRDNLGGNNWPMIAGVGVLYQTEQVGSCIYPDGKLSKWIYKDGTFGNGKVKYGSLTDKRYILRNKNLPIAILINGSTASSGETVLVSFLGSPHVKSFGCATRGATTCNEMFALPDGAQILLTTSYYADRSGKVYKGPISPDFIIPEGPESNSLVLEAAIKWITN